jgi:hypothetical protein
MYKLLKTLHTPWRDSNLRSSVLAERRRPLHHATRATAKLFQRNSASNCVKLHPIASNCVKLRQFAEKTVINVKNNFWQFSHKNCQLYIIDVIFIFFSKHHYQNVNNVAISRDNIYCRD